MIARQQREAPLLVGRDGDLAALSAVLDAACRGGLQAAVLTGEAGIGKTRLAHALAQRARERAVRVLDVRASPLDARLAYAPILRLLSPLVVDHRESLGDLPLLGRLFPQLVATPPPVASHADAALERTLLYEAVVHLVEREAAIRPLLLVLDDVHWFDQSSLELVHYLSRRLVDEPVMVVVTLRTEAAGASTTIRALIGDLQRTNSVLEIHLERLAEPEVVALVASLLEGEPPAALLPVLAARAVGTPLAVEGIVRALVEGGGLSRTPAGWALTEAAGNALPADLRDLIVDRLDRLPGAARAVVDRVAAAGGSLAHRVLAAIDGNDGSALHDALSVADGAGILTSEDSDGGDLTHRLTHPLIQEVAYAELGALRRRRLHAELARAWRLVAPGDLTSRALHHRGAGPDVEPEAALEVFLAAADRAAAASAPAEAAQQLLNAIAIVRRGHRADLLDDLLERAGVSWTHSGELDAAAAAWSEALRHVLVTDPVDCVRVARLHRRLALCERDRGRLDVAAAHVDDGFTALGQRSDATETAALHHAAIMVLGPRPEHAAALVTLADELGAPAAQVQAHLANLAVALAIGDLAQARTHGIVAADVATRLGDPFLVNRAHSELCLAMWCIGDPRGMAEHSSAGLDAARKAGSPSLEAQVLRAAMMALLIGGDLGRAVTGGDEAVDSARRHAPPRTLANNLIYRAWARVLSGDLDGGADDIAEAEAVFAGLPPDNRTRLGLGIPAGQLALERGDHAAALAIAMRFRGGAPRGGVLDLRLPSGLQILAEAQVGVGDTEAALATAAELLELGRDGGAPAAFGRRARALAQAASGSAAEALAGLDDAASIADALGLRFEAARAMLDAAEIAVTIGDPTTVARARAALDWLETCGARRHADRARRLLRRQGVLVRAARPATRRGPALSNRETEVARLVADGLTNAEIAQRLFLSPRTVTSHLDHIYVRLGVRSRVELTRFVLATAARAPR